VETTNVTLLGFTVPDDVMASILERDPVMPIQTHAFGWTLVGALREAGAQVTLLSSAPVTNYPRMPQLLFRPGPFSARGVEGRSLGFVNLIVAKHATRFVSCLWTGLRAMHRWRTQVLLIHGVHSPYLWFGVLARWLAGVRTVVVLTDPPGVVLDSDGHVAKALKSLDIAVVRSALRKVDGVVALTAALAEDFAPGVPNLILEGIVGAQLTRLDRSAGTGVTLMYAGGLTAEYGVERLVDAVKGLGDRDLTLRTVGKGPLAGWIDEQADRDDRIRRPAYLTRDEVLAEYASATLLVQPRPVDQQFVRYSFPSKLLEYLASGTPVLTTRLSGIPDDYNDHVYWIDDDSVEGIRAGIAAALDAPEEDRVRKGRAAAEFVRSTRSAAAQGRRIVDFLRARR
jgi:glycosyltransferase involved in cell wall biosynthesis